jgi:CDP-glycerol glycerophosphotransferase
MDRARAAGTRVTGLALLTGARRELTRRVRLRMAAVLGPLLPTSRWWLFGSFVGQAFGDNSAALFRWVRKERPDIPAAFVLSRSSPDIGAARAVGPVVHAEDFSTDRAAMAASVLVSSHGIHDLPGFERAHGLRVRLGHGLTGLKKTKVPRGRDPAAFMRLFDLVPVASEFERENKIDWGIPRDRIELLGVCRFDELRRKARAAPAPDEVLYLPTWRDIATDVAVAHVHAFVGHPRLHRVLERSGVRLRVLPHRMLQLSLTMSSPRVVVDKIDIQDALVRARVLVTDYSSVTWDALLLRRPVVFFAPDLESVEQTRGLYIDLRNDAPGSFAGDVDEAITAVERSLSMGFGAQCERWRERAIAFDDESNCARIVGAIEHRLQGRMNGTKASKHR